MNTISRPRGVVALLDAADATVVPHELRTLRRRALGPLLLAATLLAAWSAAAPLAGAVVAAAQIKVEHKRKTVQHQEGGIVRELLVRDGQQVRAGEALMVVGDVRGEAELALLQDQANAMRLRIARTEAEARFAPHFEPPAGLAAAPRAAEHLAREQAVFGARRQALEEQTTLVQAQVRESRAQAAALRTQIEASEQGMRLSDEELAINDRLAAEGFVHRTRLIGLQRASADYRARIGEQRGELAAAQQRAGELGARAAQLRLQYQTQATDELRDASAQLRELEQRLRPSLDHVERQTVRAPVDGEVMSLRVAAPGAVVAPREPLLELVPAGEKLVVEARIAPQDIEHVRVGAAAELRLAGSDARLLAPLPARVVFVSADRVDDADRNQAWFDVTAEVDAAALQRRPGLRLQPGMSAELYVTTSERTLLEYLLKPLGLFTQRALREP